MTKMLEAGITGCAKVLVSDANSAKTMGSGSLDVFATPAMIALIEKAAAESVQPYLDDGSTTVGTLINVKHISATPIGCTVRSECLLSEVDGRRLIFDVKAFDDFGLIGEGTHERFVITAEKFMSKTNSKLSGK